MTTTPEPDVRVLPEHEARSVLLRALVDGPFEIEQKVELAEYLAAWLSTTDVPLAASRTHIEADDETAHGYVVGCMLDATEQHGDRVIALWSDDVYRTLTGASDIEVEDCDGGDDWEVYELRRVTIPRPTGEDR